VRVVGTVLSRTSVRMRLTLAYGGLFLLAGAALLGLTYGLVRANFSVPVQVRVQASLVGPGLLPPEEAQSQAGFGAKVVPSKEAYRAYALSVESAAYRQLLVWSGLALAVMAIMSLWLGWLVAGRVLRPLQAVTAAGRRLSEQNLHRERIALEGPQDELKELADTFDAMLERLDTAFSSQRRFVANASHELRTPLAIVRTEVDVALANPRTSAAELRAMAERVRTATERSERLIESLLLLARSEREPAAREPVDLAEAAAEALDHVRPGVAMLGLRVSQVLGAGAVAGDRALLERMVANLVENAVRHNHQGGWIEVDTGVSGDEAQLRVANSGARIRPGEVAALFEPFRRLGRARTRSDRGVGLGLSIVRSVATAHGGGATASALPGGGLEVTVTLPRLRAPSPAGGARGPLAPGSSGPRQVLHPGGAVRAGQRLGGNGLEADARVEQQRGQAGERD
jgi:signal transduction histidine kinase